jgi:hypothetical protein
MTGDTDTKARASALPRLYRLTGTMASSRPCPNVGELNDYEVASVEIQLPPLSQQQRIASMLDDQITTVRQLSDALTEQLEAINKLPAAILRRAFAGEL